MTSADDLLSVALDGVAPRPEAIRACAQLSQRLAARTIELLGDGRPEPVRPPTAPRPTSKEARIIASKYPGRCRSCGAGYREGDQVSWQRGVKGAQCLTCAQ